MTAARREAIGSKRPSARKRSREKNFIEAKGMMDPHATNVATHGSGEGCDAMPPREWRGATREGDDKLTTEKSPRHSHCRSAHRRERFEAVGERACVHCAAHASALTRNKLKSCASDKSPLPAGASAPAISRRCDGCACTD